MSLAASLELIKHDLYGHKLSETEVQNLQTCLPTNLQLNSLLAALSCFRLCGVSFLLREEDDESEMGAELKWLNPSQIVEEAFSAYPGKSVLTLGYLPIASCLLGSGDPYFLNLGNHSPSDPALVRVPHDFASEVSGYPEEKIEIVSSRLSYFFQRATIERPS
jgi:hypothetical protein